MRKKALAPAAKSEIAEPIDLTNTGGVAKPIALATPIEFANTEVAALPIGVAKPSKGAKTKKTPAAGRVQGSGNDLTAKAVKRPAKPSKRRLGKARAHELLALLAAANRSPQTELEHLNPFTLLVAVVLSAQATDAGVNKATRALFAIAPTPQQMADLGEERIRDAIKTIGLFNTKAKNVFALSKALIEKYGGEVPNDRAALESLPGVGRKSANVVLNVSFGHPTIAVDTHIFRVGNRTGLAPGKTPLDVELGLERIVPPEYAMNAHHWLILHGRYVCKARKPECWRCIVADICLYKPKTPAPEPGKAASAPVAETGA